MIPDKSPLPAFVNSSNIVPPAPSTQHATNGPQSSTSQQDDKISSLHLGARKSADAGRAQIISASQLERGDRTRQTSASERGAVLLRQIAVIVATFGPAGMMIWGANSANVHRTDALDSNDSGQDVVRNMSFASAIVMSIMLGMFKSAGDRWSGKAEYADKKKEHWFVFGDSLFAAALVVVGAFLLKTEYADVPENLQVPGFNSARNLIHGFLQSDKSPLAAAYLQVAPSALRYFLREFYKFGAGCLSDSEIKIKTGEKLSALKDNLNLVKNGRLAMSSGSAKTYPDTAQRLILAPLNSFGWSKTLDLKNPDFAGPYGSILSVIWTLGWENGKRFLIDYLTEHAVPKSKDKGPARIAAPADSARDNAPGSVPKSDLMTPVDASQELHERSNTSGVKEAQPDANPGEEIFKSLSKSIQEQLLKAAATTSDPEELIKAIDPILKNEIPSPSSNELMQKIVGSLADMMHQHAEASDQEPQSKDMPANPATEEA